MLGLNEEVCPWHQRKQTGAAHHLVFHFGRCFCCYPSRPRTRLMHLIRFYFQKGISHSTLSPSLHNQGFKKKKKVFIKKSHFHLQKSGCAIKCSQDYKNRNVIKSTGSSELFASTHNKSLPSWKGVSLSRRLVELLKVSIFVSMLIAFANEFHTVCAKLARSQQAWCQQIKHPCRPVAAHDDIWQSQTTTPKAFPIAFIQQTHM